MNTRPLGHREMLCHDPHYTPAIYDIVELGGGQRLIVTEIVRSRPANPYLGVLEGGKGKKYKFGHKHRPRKVGVADKSHPALMALQQRTAETTGFSADYKALVLKLCDVVDSLEGVHGNLSAAKALAGVLKTL